MHALVLNLTRFGDLIQTQPVLTGLARDGHTVTLACVDTFSSAATLLKDVDYLVPLPGARLLAQLDRDWRLAVGELSRVRDLAVATGPVDLVVNLTPSLPARLLARVFGPSHDSGAKIVGFGVDEFGFNADTSAWAAFLQVGSASRGASPFNVVDLFCRAAGLAHGPYPFELQGPTEELSARMQRMIRAGLPSAAANAPLLGVQLGASEERRRWPVSHFVQAARMFWEQTGRAAVLFGMPAERHLAERFLAEADFPAVSLVGETGLDELGGALVNMELLLTNDTGTMHLAAGLGIPVAAIFLATAQPFDTGPYIEGSLCFEPDMKCHPCEFGKPCDIGEACRKAVQPITVFEAGRVLLEQRQDVMSVTETSGARVWLTRIGESGLMELVSLSDHSRDDRTVWIDLQRHHYRRFLDGEAFTEFESSLSLSHDFCEEVAKTLEEAKGLLFLLGQQGKLLASGAPQVMQQKFMGNWQRLQDVFNSCPPLTVLGILWMFQSQSEGTDMVRLLELISRYQKLVDAFIGSLAVRHES